MNGVTNKPFTVQICACCVCDTQVKYYVIRTITINNNLQLCQE